MSIFLEYSIPSLMKNIMAGSITFMDMADAVKRTIGEVEKSTLAWVSYDLEKLQRSSELAFSKFEKEKVMRSLEGIPFGIKDVFNTRDFPTQMGSPLWKGFEAGNDARVVASLFNKGALGVGKTVTAEFAVHALNETLNPHDKDRTPGTSSSGSAAAVARGMVPFALASQTAGSIIRPASFCGVWGMKPSFGLIPRTGSLKTTDSLDTVGFIAAHGESLRPLLDSTRVRGPNYPFVYRQLEALGDFPKSAESVWKVGFVKTKQWNGASEYSKKSLQNLAKKIDMEKNFAVDEILLPEALDDIFDVHSAIYNKSLSYYFQNEIGVSSTHASITPLMGSMIDKGQEIDNRDYINALRRQEFHCEVVDEVLSAYDFVLSLSTASSAPRREVEEQPDPSLVWTHCHVPAVCAPVFKCPNELPFGAQFISRRGNDYLLLQAIETLINSGILPGGSQDIGVP